MRPKKILITEDEGVIAMDLQCKLELLGYEVTGIANSADSAIELLEQDVPDIALMDVHILGNVDGIEVAKIFQEKYKVPVVFLTANSDSITLDRAKKTNAYGYVLKPISEKNLYSVLEMALHKHGSEKEVTRQSSLARENPNPIIEVSLNSNINYANQKALEVFPDLFDMGVDHPSLAEVKKVFDRSSEKEDWIINKEAKCEEYVYHQKICFHPSEGVFRVYYNDITKLHASEIQLSRKNARLLQRNRNITDSINYAKNIQSAIIPSVKDLQEVFKRSFVIYQPKDIVSGDFYWCHNIGWKSIVAVVDCTGHGVPGALMSMLGSNLLNRIIKQEGIEEPSEVLKRLNEYITETLNNNRNRSKSNDGMDVSICVLDNETNVLTYSGAYRPLYFVRDEKLEVFQGSISSIGGHDDIKKEFFSTVIPVKKNDCFYIFSDGYPDQFGGENGKKFTSKRLKNMFVDIANESLEQQEIVVKSSFENWKGETDQIDDVCVIGVRI